MISLNAAIVLVGRRLKGVFYESDELLPKLCMYENNFQLKAPVKLDKVILSGCGLGSWLILVK